MKLHETILCMYDGDVHGQLWTWVVFLSENANSHGGPTKKRFRSDFYSIGGFQFGLRWISHFPRSHAIQPFFGQGSLVKWRASSARTFRSLWLLGFGRRLRKTWNILISVWSVTSVLSIYLYTPLCLNLHTVLFWGLDVFASENLQGFCGGTYQSFRKQIGCAGSPINMFFSRVVLLMKEILHHLGYIKPSE